MQLKEFFEKFEISPKLWGKRHGISAASLQSWISFKAIPGASTRAFITHCTLGNVTEADWLEVLYGDAIENSLRAVDSRPMDDKESDTSATEEDCDFMADIRDDADEATDPSGMAFAL